ncbi:Histone-lysine N-methyltransferase set9 [Actinomortierella ambigua]|uniref:Histone-lysine N-methyltransferase set9 n=1 Tax=Actinomortierella ambigua TaxID=1343610 RepID=A0A9P6TZ91_9FUNG|nr:Histone-lysine N-methyltransferase set9 [Actinomortierella ambigua]
MIKFKLKPVFRTPAVYHTLEARVKETLGPYKDMTDKVEFSLEELADNFRAHARRYLSLHQPTANIDVGPKLVAGQYQTCVTANANINTGDLLSSLTGTVVDLKEFTEQEKMDFVLDYQHSGAIRAGPQGTSVLLGPVRFVNHDCDPNCKIVLAGHGNISLGAVKPIRIHEEITINFASEEKIANVTNDANDNQPFETSEMFMCSSCRRQYPEKKQDFESHCPRCVGHFFLYCDEWPKRRRQAVASFFEEFQKREGQRWQLAMDATWSKKQEERMEQWGQALASMPSTSPGDTLTTIDTTVSTTSDTTTTSALATGAVNDKLLSTRKKHAGPTMTSEKDGDEDDKSDAKHYDESGPNLEGNAPCLTPNKRKGLAMDKSAKHRRGENELAWPVKHSVLDDSSGEVDMTLEGYDVVRRSKRLRRMAH